MRKPLLLIITGLLVTAALFGAGVNGVGAGGDQQVCFTCPGGAEPKVDFACQREKIFNPQASCDLCLCPGEEGITEETFDVNLFGVVFRINSAQSFTHIIYLGFSFFLGIIAIATVGYAVYGAYKRSIAENEDQIAEAQKIITSAIAGLALVVVGIVLAQVVAAFLGVPSLNESVDFTRIFGR